MQFQQQKPLGKIVCVVTSDTYANGEHLKAGQELEFDLDKGEQRVVAEHLIGANRLVEKDSPGHEEYLQKIGKPAAAKPDKTAKPDK